MGKVKGIYTTMTLRPRNSYKVNPRADFLRRNTGGLLIIKNSANETIIIDVSSINRAFEMKYHGNSWTRIVLRQDNMSSATDYNLSVTIDAFREIWSDLKAGFDCDIREFLNDPDYILDHWPADHTQIQKIKEKKREHKENIDLEQLQEASRIELLRRKSKSKGIEIEARWAS